MKVHILDNTVFAKANWSVLPNVVFGKDADVLAIGVSKIIDDAFLVNFPNCKYILSPSTAIDHIQITKPVKIINLIPSEIENITASAEFAFLLILSLLRKYPFVGDRENLIGNDLNEKIVGILGFGRIGRKIKKYATSFGAHVIEHDKSSYTAWSKNDVLEKSDIVLLSITSSPENRNYLTLNDFKKMKKGAYFVNISRGFLINDDDLANVLSSKHLCGAALDVVDNLLAYKNLDNIIITPHIAGSTYESQEKACNFVINKLSQMIKDVKNV